MEYDFSQLNDKELEILAVDILEKVIKHRLERFKPGKDSGVDGRHFITDTKEVVMQCKHYSKSGVNRLLKCLKNDELPKIKVLNPARYLLVTSCPLSRKNKESIREALDPYIKSSSDIFGAEDLNDILRVHPEIEKTHSKLWMSSTNLLRRFLNNGVYGRSEEFLKHVSAKRKLFVETKSLIHAHKKLEKNQVVILSGEPGVGKTTLAENLCFLYATEGYEIFDAINLNEAESVYQNDAKQIFLFDDFLGGNYLEAITGNEDSHIVKFIRRVIADPQKRFVLTSRTNILNLGILISDKLANANIRQKEYLLEVSELTEIEKAKILYNHIWHSNLPDSLVDELYKSKRYLEIIKHQNFNPRIIEFITDYLKLDSPEPQEYWASVQHKLNKPESVWRHALLIQSNEQTRALVKLVVFSGGTITEELLNTSFLKYAALGGFTSSQKLADFRAICEIASKSFLVRSIDKNDKVSYALFNPSIADFILWNFCGNTEDLKKLFTSLGFTAALVNLKGLCENNFITESQFAEIVIALDHEHSASDISLDYRIFLTDMLPVEKKFERVKNITDEIETSPRPLTRSNLLIKWILEDSNLLKESDFAFLAKVIIPNLFEKEDFIELSKIIDARNLYISETLIEFFRDNLKELVADHIHDSKNELDLDYYITRYSYGDGSCDVDLNENKIKSELTDLMSDFLSDFPPSSVGNIVDNYLCLIDEIDYDDLLNSYLDKSSDNWEYEGENSANTSDSIDQQIHDLFYRG